MTSPLVLTSSSDITAQVWIVHDSGHVALTEPLNFGPTSNPSALMW